MLSSFALIAQIGRLDTGFGEGRAFDVIAAAVLGGASLFGGVGTALGAVVGATPVQKVRRSQVCWYLQPMMQGLIILIAVLMDGAQTSCAIGPQKDDPGDMISGN